MRDCRCDLDCRELLRAAIRDLDPAISRLLTAGRLEQVCDQCGAEEPAGGMCSRCGHCPQPTAWWIGATRLGRPLSGVLSGSTASREHSEQVA